MATFEQALKAIAINRSIAPSRKGQYRKAELTIKQALIDEAKSYPGTTPKGNFIYTKIWEDGDNSVQFGKYGKEYYREGDKRNVNDIAPTIFHNDEICEYDASFRAIFRLSENLKNDGDTNSLLILGCLFVIITSEGGKTPSRFKHVIEDPVNHRLRRLIPLELERLDMFPDNHTIGQNDVKRAFFMGNALV